MRETFPEREACTFLEIEHAKFFLKYLRKIALCMRWLGTSQSVGVDYPNSHYAHKMVSCAKLLISKKAYTQRT